MSLFCTMPEAKIHVGKKIKRIRAYKGITQEMLAEKIGKTRALISYLERTGNINKFTLTEIAEALGITVAEIEDLQIENVNAKNNRSKKSTILPPPVGIVEQLRSENEFLKTTITKQWEVIEELTNKITSLANGLKP